MKRKNIFNALLVAGLLVATPLAADAAGLGQLKVISALGQPLRAEIDLISVPKDEVDLITARIATSDAYKRHNIEQQEGLTNVRFSVEKRPNGEPYLKVTSTQAFNEPFLDLLIQLDWPSGSLLREYTILLDPPGFQDKPTAPAVSAPVAQFEPAVKPATMGKPVPLEAPAEPSKVEKKSGKAIKHGKQASKVKPQKPEPIVKAQPAPPPRQLTPAEQTFPRFEGDQSSAQAAPQTEQAPLAAVKPTPQEYKVKKGDSLSKVAREMKPEGYSLEQMMVALYERNKRAFDGNNMNRMKTGQILRVPDKSELDATSQSAAVKEIRVQAADWNAYRQKLAGAVAEQQAAKEEAKPEATGKITAKAEDKGAKPPAPEQDVLKLSRGETAGKGKGAAGKGGGVDAKALQDKLIAAQDDAVAKEKALKEANSRIAELDKNVKEMQALLDLKSKQMAELEKQAKAKPLAVPPPVAKAEAPKPEPVTPQAKPEPEKPATAAAPAVEKPIEPLVKAVPEQAKPSAQPEQKKPLPVPAPKKAPEPETSFMDTVMSNPLYLGGSAAAVVGALFAALWALGRRRKKSLASFEDSIMTTGGGDLKTNTVFGNTAGGQIDTGDTSFLTDFSQAGMGAIDTNDVDPIAEAEVYMAYGRDAQAEEILKEAMSKDPNRHEIQLKLLEIYAGRKNTAAFETLAAELYAATSGQGPEWAKAAELGRSLDAGNPLYAVPEGRGGEAMAGGVAAAAGSAATAAAVAPDLDFNLDIDTQGGIAHAESAKRTEPVDEGLGDTLDFDLDTPGRASEPALEDTQGMSTLDFNLDTIIPQAVEKHAEAPAQAPDFSKDDLAFDIPELSAVAPATATSKEEDEDTLALDFDFNLDQEASTPAPAAVAQTAEEPMMPELDLSGIDLNLEKPAPRMDNLGGQPLEEATTLVGDNTVWEEASTKLDLARAYLEMGDKEGAREILQEVVAEGGLEQQENAKKLLATLS